MRRKRHHRDTKVWHDPLLSPVRRQSDGRSNGQSKGSGTDGGGSDGEATGRRRRKAEPAKRNGVRIVAAARTTDPRELERERLLQRVLLAEGRPSITKTAELYVEAGFDFPHTQDVWLQLLEHNDEGHVQRAIEQLTTILEDEAPVRRAVLESRLRRIEEYADEHTTQRTAANLRRILKAKYASLNGGG
jgi:bacterioferritin (cytochrome b1)